MDACNLTGAALAITRKHDHYKLFATASMKSSLWSRPILMTSRLLEAAPLLLLTTIIHKKANLCTGHLHPDSSHALNVHHNATDAHTVITDFLGEWQK